MAEQQNGLRFDIYERVHLSEGVAGIKELEDVELVPHIQVLPQGDQALLRGNLLLSGTYLDEQDAVNRTLEHLIPVEITLPMNRVHRVEDIAVEIENFDVDLLSARSLNITGVLSLNGLEVVSAAPDQGWEEVEEEVVFVHEAADPRFVEAAPSGGAAPFQPDSESSQPEQEWSSSALAYAAANPIPESSAFTPQEDRHSLSLEAGAFPSSSLVTEEASELNASEPAEAETVKLTSVNESSLLDDKKDLKIAFTGKTAEEPVVQAKPIGLTSLLKSAVAAKTETRLNQERLEEEAKAAAGAGQKLEWKKLLLSTMNEQQEFRRVRLCIVQKEETLEIIAKRYDLNPREIALFNRLSETDLSEGQIVYIPK